MDSIGKTYLNKFSVFDAAASSVGAAASLWNAFEQGRYHKDVINQQKKSLKMAQAEVDRQNRQRRLTQESFNKVWGI